MTPIQPRLSPNGRIAPGDVGPLVVNVQECLLFLLAKDPMAFVTPVPPTVSQPDPRRIAADLTPKIEAEKGISAFRDATKEAVVLFQSASRVGAGGIVDDLTADRLNSLLKELGAFGTPGEPVVVSPSYTVEGTVFSPDRAGVGGLVVVIVDKNVGADVPLADTKTDERGSYTVSIPEAVVAARGKKQPDLQARAQLAQKFLAASEVRYDASTREVLDVLLPANASLLPSEHETLTGALAGHFTGKLGDLKEDEGRQDVTYLANKTGWDARAVAMAALADQFSARTADAAGAAAIPQAFFYALFRAGLPANEDTLYQVDPKTLEGVWKQAAEQGVIPQASADQVPNLVKQFQDLSAQKLLTTPALVGASSLKELLTSSRLDDAQQATFAQLYAANSADLPTFWQNVRNTFGQDISSRLQVDGKLGFLTINNAPLMQKVHLTAGANGISDPLQLAQTGYHRAEPWSQLLTEDVPIPNEISGDTPEAKRANYASYLAAQVRLSYPTAAVAQMVKSGELPLTGAANDLSDQVHAFLTEHQGKFEIGVQPVHQYIAQNNVQVADQTVEQVKRLQRVYQITPSDRAMNGLMKHGIDAAYHVVRYDKDTFVQSFAADLGGPDHAALTYDRSVQIHNTVLNVALGYLNARTAPAIGIHSPPSVLDPAPAHPGDVIAYATLETLFGSMEFCACEHCRSILSPAAYLVDLLLFLDRPGTGNPQTVLLERRPDIEHLPLTCENTNTALPYIDVVNETLEYFIANNSQKLSLKDYQGHDTNDAVSEDLLASPQFVMDSAYETLRNGRFPLAFNRQLENQRRYFSKFDVPLPLAMERLRKTDDLERGANPYGWRDILMEEIGFSRDEYEILSDSNRVPLWRMYGFPDGTADADVIAGLSNAKQYARRVGITYEDLISIVKTRFINPASDLIPKLERLGVDFAMLAELKTKNDALTDTKFDNLLANLAVPPNPAEYGGDIKAWVKNDDNSRRIMGLLTLAIPASTWAASTAHVIGDCVKPAAAPSESPLYYGCTTPGTSGAAEPAWPMTPGKTANDGTAVWTCRDASSCLSFDDLAFRYSDPAKIAQNVDPAEFVRLLRFIRLWKKLGWTIEQTDAAICAFYRADLASLEASDIDDVMKLNAGFLTLLPRLGIVSRVMRALALTVKRDLLPLLVCWSEIGTRGATGLYRQMFLNPALLQQDAVFEDNGYGEFLTDTTKKLAEHAEALRSAFNLTGDEYDAIAAALTYDANTALTIPNISAIYRRGWLARKLKISVRELLLLIQLTGLDPFAVPDPVNPAILRLVSLVQTLKDRSLKSAAALYLIWNRDLSGKSAPDSAQIAAFARTLRLGLAAVEAEFVVADDPDGAIAQTRMALVYGADAAAFFFGVLNDTLIVEAAFSDPDATLAPGAVRQAIDNAAGKTNAGVPKITYDDFRKRLSYSGVLSITTRDAIKLAAGAGAMAFKMATDNLYGKTQAVIGPFFARYPELQSPYDTYASDKSRSVSEKRTILLKAILPELVKRRKRQQALQAVSVGANTDLALTQTFLDRSAAPFPLHATGHADQPALNDLLALETPGLSVQFFASDTATGTIIPSPDIASNLDYSPAVPGVGNPLPANPAPAAAISAIWRGYLEAPESGFFDLRIEADAGATVTLLLDDKPVTLTQTATLWNNKNALELRAGTLYSIKLTVEKVRNVVRVQWDWEPSGQGRAVISARYLYPTTTFDAFKETYVRFLKAASLATGLGLTANEMEFFATHPNYQIAGDGWLNAPSASDPAAGTVSALLKPFEALLDFARIKGEISRDNESLLGILRDPTSATDSAERSAVASNKNKQSLLYSITQWNQTSLNDVLSQFGDNIAGLKNFELFRRVYDAFALIQKMGISANALIQATTNQPAADTVRALQSALRARYDASGWRDVVQPINDEMRGLQRDALVAYILHQMRSHPESAHIDTPDKLFEYFLMDVQMDPCMQTSRIRHALSSVQLFIERCLMNLETGVSPAAINAKQWEWMKRYRVWEANRKVYLFPENWLEPELRDDKSPFFKEIESELLQSDITEDSATTALLNYLSKLEEVAKLEPCGVYHIPKQERTGEINHVVARTAGAHRKYYYRRYEYRYWTPWEQIKLDIEDNPVVPVVWNDRLFLFWLRIIKQGQIDPTAQTFSPGPRGGDNKEMPLANVSLSEIKGNVQKDGKTNTKLTVLALLCWSEYYNGKWQPTKTSDVNRPANLGSFDVGGSQAFDRSSLRLSVREEETLRVEFTYKGPYLPVSFLLFNTHSLPEIFVGLYFNWKFDRLHRIFNLSGNSLEISYLTAGLPPTILPRRVLKEGLKFQAIEPRQQLLNPWDTPFLYEDSRNVFYVTTIETPVRIWDVLPYGAQARSRKKPVAEIPPLVFKIDPKALSKPRLWGDGAPIGLDPGTISLAPIERFVTEDAFIRNGLGTVGAVSFGGRQIGPSGAITKI